MRERLQRKVCRFLHSVRASSQPFLEPWIGALEIADRLWLSRLAKVEEAGLELLRSAQQCEMWRSSLQASSRQGC